MAENLAASRPEGGHLERLQRLGPDLNAFTFRFDEALLRDIRDSYARELMPMLQDPARRALFEGGRLWRGSVGPQYYLVSYDLAPLLWFSADTPETYVTYQRCFDAMGIAQDIKQLVDYDAQIVMYCGFLVVGDRAPEPLWHYDYRPGANAYTLITPLFELDPAHGHLLYDLSDGSLGRYVYRPGEAIVFGEGFLHSTETYASPGTIRVLLSMTFGTDKLEYWPVLKKAVTAQSNFYRLPCGHAVNTCTCLARAFFKRTFGR